MKTNQQTGSAHVIVTIVLVVALLGALGFIAYQNFVVKKSVATTSAVSASTTQSTATTPAAPVATDKYSGWKTYTDSSLGFSFRYPADWQQGGNAGTVTFASPSTIEASKGSMNGPSYDVTITTVKKSQSTPTNGTSLPGSLLALKADQNGQDISQYCTKKYSETINSITFSEYDMIAQTPYFSAVFTAGDSYVVADFGTTQTKADMSTTIKNVLSSFKLN